LLHGLIIALGLGGGWACVRLLRGRAVAWFGLPVLAALLAVGAWALSGGVGSVSGLTPLLSLSLLACGAGAGLGAAAHSDWNTRRQLGLSLVLLALSAEGALLLAWLGKGHSANASPSLVLLFAGLSLALVAFRQGVLPDQVRWRAGLRLSVALCSVLGVGLWWWHCEVLAWQAQPGRVPVASLTADLVANVSHQGAWAVWGAAGVAGVLLLAAASQPWVRRLGAGLALAIGILLPLPTIAMRWTVQEHCEEHLPEARGLFDAIVADPPIEIPAGWCRAPLTPSLKCPRTPTLYQQSTGRVWVARRLEADPLDTLWRQRWTRPGSVQGQPIRGDFGRPHLGSWLVSGGNREPEDLDGTLEDLIIAMQGCGLPVEPAPAMVLDLVIAESGEVRSVDLRSASSYSIPERACLEEMVIVQLKFPVSSCAGDQRVTVPIYAGEEAD
jgi:hypothetical protein